MATDHGDTSDMDMPVQTAPGIAMYDANTYQPVLSSQYKTNGVTSYSEPHGVGVSPDGKWIYLQGVHPSSDLVGNAALFIINARTMKVDKIIRSRVHHARVIHSAKLNKDLILIDGWGTFFALDPSDNNKVVGSINPANLNGSGYLAFGDPSGKYLFITTRTGFGTDGGVAVASLDDWTIKTRINTQDADPIWVDFTADAKTAYVTGGENSMVAKIDFSDANLGNWKVTGITSAGTAGPYGINLNWKEDTLFAIGKGEGTHNLGNTVGVLSTTSTKFSSIGEVFTGCTREDHAVLHPNPAKNELWISCNSSFNNVVLAMGDGTFGSVWVKQTLGQPAGGSSHGGAMVTYTVTGTTWNGELLSDTNGLHGSALQAKKDILAGGGTTPGGGGGGGGGTTTPANGQQLFTSYCGACHTKADRAGRTADQIKAAINGVPAMGTLSFLSAAQIQTISDYLGTP
jgi:hypothetical protein